MTKFYRFFLCILLLPFLYLIHHYSQFSHLDLSNYNIRLVSSASLVSSRFRNFLNDFWLPLSVFTSKLHTDCYILKTVISNQAVIFEPFLSDA